MAHPSPALARPFMKPLLLLFLSMLLARPILAMAEPTVTPSASAIAIVTLAAAEARRRCHEFMHEDADEYVGCIDALVAAVPARERPGEQRRLGILYFAWVGANNSARLSLPGAEAAALHYLPMFRRLQQQEGIQDDDLCRTIEGACDTRTAQVLQQETQLKSMAATAPARPLRTRR